MANKLIIRRMDAVTRQDAEIAAALATYMYVITRIAAPDGMKLGEIIRSVDAGEDKVKKSAAYIAFRSVVLKYPDLMMNLVLYKQSHIMEGEMKNARAAAFTAAGRAYVAYRGTYDLEWTDNGIGLFERSTRLQRLAADYFDRVAQELSFNDGMRITVCGHSKGGNKAQFVTLGSQYANLIDRCWSFDGQGFSPEAIKYYKKSLGSAEYHKRIAKMVSVCGENDYVNPLGVKIIPSGNTYYLSTPEAALERFLSNHIMENLWEKGEDGYTGSLNSETASASLCRFSRKLSKSIMRLPVDERQGVALTVTQLIENIDGEKVSKEESKSTKEMVNAMTKAVPGVFSTAFLTVEGRRLILGYADVFADAKNRQKGMKKKDKGFWQKVLLWLRNAGIHFVLSIISLILAVPVAIVWGVGAIRRWIGSFDKSKALKEESVN
ncbi:MAG: DUF2974 domain-containing protein [Clostridia bacterium]|nr:DUF2974 domain-containing protein [Clostridia bacterium]